MNRVTYGAVSIVSAMAIPVLDLLAPSWFALMGVGPAWSILWLLPWSILHGPVSGLLAGLALGLSLDSISLDNATHIPALVILGCWWGYLGKRSLLVQRAFALGLLGWIGSVILSFCLWIQFFIIQIGSTIKLFNSWSLHTLLSQAILTMLMAPLICSLLLFCFKGMQNLSFARLKRLKF